MQHCKVLELFCGFYWDNVSLVGDSTLLVTGANCGKVSKQNETSHLGLLTSSVLPHHFCISRCSTVNSVHIRVLTVLPHHFHISPRSTVNSVHISMLTVLPHQFRFSLCTTAQCAHTYTHSLAIHRFDVSTYRGTQHAPTSPHGIHVHIMYGIMCKSEIRNTRTVVNVEGVSNKFNEKIHIKIISYS